MISVIIPTLNEEKLLPALLAQFSPDVIRKFDLELIVSDGGSTDATIALHQTLVVVLLLGDVPGTNRFCLCPKKTER